MQLHLTRAVAAIKKNQKNVLMKVKEKKWKQWNLNQARNKKENATK